MCKLMIGLQIKPSDDFAKIVDIQAQDIARLPHGLGAVNMDFENNVMIAREYGNYNLVMKKFYSLIPGSKVLGLHSRQATSGACDKSNVHFFHYGNYLFAHNGIITKVGSTSYNNQWPYGTKNQWHMPTTGTESEALSKNEIKRRRKHLKSITPELWYEEEMELQDINVVLEDCRQCFKITKKWCELHLEEGERYTELRTSHLHDLKTKEKDIDPRCDSLQFLMSLPPKGLTAEDLAKKTDEKGFTGVAVLFDIERKIGFLFGTREIKVQTDFKNYVLFYSFDPENTILSVQSIAGFPVILEENEEIPTYSMPGGMYEFSFDGKIQMNKAIDLP